ncbi:MAG TPA: isoleucine--tRNA ligase [Phycisphaerae bacterium]|nr:isoleucine--tRNA ligase [Phycisphaerae bacterium]
MAFEKVEPKIDFPAAERDILAFWKETGAFEALRAQNAGKKKWSFLDGPITANNPMGVHHAWGRTYKDVYQRYHAALGEDLRYQNGFDCQGLWVEVEVEKERGFSDKKEIEAFGIDRFVEECKARVRKYAGIQTAQSVRLGQWMDWDNSYYTMSDVNNYGIWDFLKRCYDDGRIYKGADVMPWCARCGCGISQMEVAEGYREVPHISVFLRFPIRERAGEALLVWTTTPWTLTSNVAAAVHPELTYLKVRQGDTVYYVGKDNFENPRSHPVEKAEKYGAAPLKSIQAIFDDAGGYEVLGEVQGKDLVGLTYEGPFDRLEGQVEGRKAHRVVEWDLVSETEGSGIVHIAPGCGSEDYHLGKEMELPAIAPLEENGKFGPGFGEFTGRRFDEVAEDIVADLRSRGFLVARESYLHRYPHCWRCRDELVYRLVDEWFIKMDWRDRIMEATRSAQWIPEWGMERELDWLRNMGDWMISKKRFWGLALPIWECEKCGHFEVIGGRQELEKRAVSGWEEFDGHTPHRPWVDAIKIECAECGNDSVSRVGDVGNPWLDASIVSFSTMGYFEDRKYWEQWFPADFVVESLPGQFRNWFYALLAISTYMVDKSPFKTLKGYGLVVDDQGRPMSKSAGNAVDFDQAAETLGVDVMRWMYCDHPPERNLPFGPRHANETRKRFILPLWNTYSFFANYARLDGFDPMAEKLPVEQRTDLDRWILSELQLLVAEARRAYGAFDVRSMCVRTDKFVADLSTWYIKRSRRRFWKSEWSDDKRAAYQTLYEVLTTLNRAIAPVTVFLSEVIYQNLVANQVPGSPKSVHHLPFPDVDEKLIDRELSQQVAASLKIVSLARSARTASKLKVRQPLAEMIVTPYDETERAAVAKFESHMLEELNVKQITVRDSVAEMCTISVALNKKLAGPKYGRQFAAIAAVVEAADHAAIASRVEDGFSVEVEVEGQAVHLDAEEITVTRSYGVDWIAAADGGTVVLLDRRITEELKQEGVARDIVRFVQVTRKEAGLELEDRIVLSLRTESDLLRAAIARCGDYIAAETLATEVRDSDVDNPAGAKDARIAGSTLNITLRRT